MQFNRSPRFRRPLEYQKLDIPKQPALPTKPKINWLTVGLPLVAVGLAISLMIWLSGPEAGLSYMMFLPFMAASVLASIITYRMQMKEYWASKKENENNYQQMIKDKKQKLMVLVNDQRSIMFERQPSLAEIMLWAQEQNPRLGERRPQDDDFLVFRTGLGSQPSQIEISISDDEKRDTILVDLCDDINGLNHDGSVIDLCPIVLDLKESGCIGISGNSNNTRAITRTILVNLTATHWLTEVNLVVFIGEKLTRKEYKWVELIPHRTTLFSKPVVEITEKTSALEDTLLLLENEIHKRQELLQSTKRKYVSKPSSNSPLLPALIIVFDHVPAIYQKTAFSLILKYGKELSVYGIFIVDRPADVPGECGANVGVSAETLVIKQVGENKKTIDKVKPDFLDVKNAQIFAQALGSIQWLVPGEVTEPPNTITLLEIFNVSSVEDLQIAKWWDDNPSYGYLRAPIGRITPTADLIFDLNDNENAHGPHGIIGGTTGSGKSEVLRTIILSLAMTHHPFDINFALIDYKGGGAFKDLEDLPHVVGVITDIEHHADYARRVILALTGEIQSRKERLQEAQHNTGLLRQHIDDYRLLPVKRPLPRLIIIFDEYAEFKDRHPEETKKLINIARQGRSLGVHLILCTQNPAAAVEQQVRQNSKFAICLRVNSPEDSRELLDIPDAWGLPTGLAYLYVKNPLKFKVAFSGAPLTNSAGEKITEAKAITETIKQTARNLNLGSPPRVWPEPLRERLYLPDLFDSLKESGFPNGWNGNTWLDVPMHSDGPVIGLIDDPVHQKQPIFKISGRNGSGHLIAVGGSGSGKSTFLSTIASSLARMYSPKQIWIYGLDLSGQLSSKISKDLPHIAEVGGIIAGEEKERINRLFSVLRSIITERFTLFQGVGGDIYTYNNQVSTQHKLPHIYILVDGLSRQFAESSPGFDDQVIEILLFGHSAGIHFIVTANIPQDVSKIAAYIQERVYLRPLERSKVEDIVGRLPQDFVQQDIEIISPPGRGLKQGSPVLEFQVALPAFGDDDEVISLNLRNMSQKMKEAWRDCPGPFDIEILPSFVFLEKLVEQNPGLFTEHDIPLGVSQDTLTPVSLSISKDGPTYLIASTDPKKGKTSLVQTWLLSLMSHSESNVKFFVVDFHRHSLRAFAKLNANVTYIGKKDELVNILKQIKGEMISRQKKIEEEYSKNPDQFEEADFFRRVGYILIVIDDYDAFRTKSDSNDQKLLFECLTQGEDLGVRLLLSENVTLMGTPITGDVLKVAFNHGCGVMLGGTEGMEKCFQTKVPYGQKTAQLTPGRGYLINRGQVQLFQASAFWPDGKDSLDYLNTKILGISK